jgi:L-lactate dehydrogenase complex protein LldG
MSTSTSTRESILGRLKSIRPERPADLESVAPAYQRAGQLDARARVKLMSERLQDYGATAVECSGSSLRETIRATLTSAAVHSIVLAPGASPQLLPETVDCKIDHDLSYEEIEQSQCVLTESSCGIAESGTIVLHHGPTEGRRVISLLPDHHLCLLKSSDIVETLPEYFERLQKAPRLSTFISGPSATVDIEMTRVKGVHGPRFLHVVIVDDVSS